MNGEKPFGLDDFCDLVSFISVPVLVRNHEAMIERYSGMTVEEFEEYLQDDHHLLEACDALGDYLAASDAWFRLYGDPSEERSGLPDTVGPMSRGGGYPEFRHNLIQQLCAPFRDIRSLVCEHSVPGPHGRDIIVRSYWKAAGGFDNPYARTVVVDLDVTDMRRTEKAAQEVAESRSRILRTVGHELRNPLAGISGIAQVVNEEWDSLDDDSRKSLMETVATQAQDTMVILEDLLAGAATEQSDVVVELRPVDITEIITRVDLADFELQISEIKPAMADPLRTRQIIRNLAQNARKYGGPERKISCDTEDGWVVIRVSDNGEGIKGINLERLFQPFNSSNHQGSTGLGLSISKTLALAMGGDLTLREDLPGTVFELTLPVSRINAGIGTAA